MDDTTPQVCTPMQVGNAIVDIEHTDVDVQTTGELGTQSRLDPLELFGRALEVIEESVGLVGHRIDAIKQVARPQEVTFAFSVRFTAGTEGGFLTFAKAKAEASGGLNVTAVLKESDAGA